MSVSCWVDVAGMVEPVCSASPADSPEKLGWVRHVYHSRYSFSSCVLSEGTAHGRVSAGTFSAGSIPLEILEIGTNLILLCSVVWGIQVVLRSPWPLRHTSVLHIPHHSEHLTTGLLTSFSQPSVS